MGALHLPSKGRDANDGTSSPAIIINRSSGQTRTKAPFHVRKSGIVLVISMLVSLAYQPLSSIAADGTRRLSQLEQSAESKRELNFTTVKLISGRCAKESYAKGTDYAYNVKDVLAKLIEGIDVDLEIWEDASDFYDNLNTVYGVAGCTNLSREDCRLCLSHIVAHLEEWCRHHSSKVEIMLNSCFLRYDNNYIKAPLTGSRRADNSC